MSTISETARRQLTRRRAELTHLWKANTDAERAAASTRPADWPDLAVEREAAEVLEHLTEREHRELLDIDAAILRLRTGDFGKCERCGGAIGRQRLLALPQARLCITCESALERALNG